jgi:hypothetical protein
MHQRNFSRVQRTARRLVLLCACMLSFSLFVPPACLADSMQLALSKEAVQEETTQVTYTASSEAVGFTALAVNNAGTTCASQPEADSGTALNDEASEAQGQTGTYSGSVNFTPQNTGPYVLCGWVTGYGPGQSSVLGPTIATASLPIEVRAPHISLSLGVPHRLAAHKSFTLELKASSEVKRSLSVVAVPNTADCPVSPAATTAKNLLQADVEGGPRVFTTKIAPLAGASKWIFCAYADAPQDKGEDPQATASAILTVVTPSPHHHKKKHKRRHKRR